MPCFLNTDAAPNTDLQSFNAKSRQVDLAGSWSTEQDSNGLKFRVSKKNGDTLTLIFTGTQIYISGRINSKTGMQALFGIDEDGKEGGGVLCSTAAQPSSSLFLYGASSLLPGRHTLFIANQGHEVSLSGFQTVDAVVSTTSTSHTSTPSPTVTTSSLISLPSSSNNSTSAVSGGTSLQTATSLQSTFPTLPTPRPSVISSHSSSSDLTQGSLSSGMATLSTISGPSYTVSIYTTVSIIDGTTTTLVVESTGVTQHRLASHRPLEGTMPGAVVGGVLFFSFLLSVALWWRNRRRRNRLPFMKGAKSSDPEPDMATHLIPSATPSIYRPVSLAIPSVLEITAGGTRDRFHLDAEADGLPSPSVPPSFHSDPENYSLGLGGDLRRSDTIEVALTDIQAVGTSSADPKTDSTPGDTPATRSPSSPAPDQIAAPTPAVAPRGARNVWRVRGRAPRLWVEEDGGVRLAGGPLMDARGEDGSEGWDVLPPPYAHRSR